MRWRSAAVQPSSQTDVRSIERVRVGDSVASRHRQSAEPARRGCCTDRVGTHQPRIAERLVITSWTVETHVRRPEQTGIAFAQPRSLPEANGGRPTPCILNDTRAERDRAGAPVS